ncbi:MAG: hypothetical protein ABGW81_07500 [Paracoccaceae bacterium]
MTDDTDIDLDAIFNDAKRATPELGNTLMVNILADAGEVTAARQVPREPRQVRSKSRIARVLEHMGGMRGVTAVGFSAVLGVMIGYTGTDTLQSVPGVGDIVASISSDPLDDFSFGSIASFNFFLAEG